MNIIQKTLGTLAKTNGATHIYGWHGTPDNKTHKPFYDGEIGGTLQNHPVYKNISEVVADEKNEWSITSIYLNFVQIIEHYPSAQTKPYHSYSVRIDRSTPEMVDVSDVLLHVVGKRVEVIFALNGFIVSQESMGLVEADRFLRACVQCASVALVA